MPPLDHINTMTTRFISITLTALISLGGCNLIYKQNVQQGNALEQEDLDELYVGMNRRQVLFVLGTPSIRDPFHQDRWDYVQTYSRRGGPLIQRTVTLRFENEALAEIIGAENAIESPIEESAELTEGESEDSAVISDDTEPDEKFEKGQEVLDQGTDEELDI